MNDMLWRHSPGGLNPGEWAKRLRPLTTERKLRLLAVAFARLVWDGLGIDSRLHDAVLLAEQLGDGTAGVDERRRGRSAVDELFVRDRRGYATIQGKLLQAAYLAYDLLDEDVVDAVSAVVRQSSFLHHHTDHPQLMETRVALLKDVFGNPYTPIPFAPDWRTEPAVGLARTMYESRHFDHMPILADALEEAGCEVPEVLAHCRDPDGVHVRGCWVVDGVLGMS